MEEHSKYLIMINFANFPIFFIAIVLIPFDFEFDPSSSIIVQCNYKIKVDFPEKVNFIFNQHSEAVIFDK